jgi:hypothetical protein
VVTALLEVTAAALVVLLAAAAVVTAAVLVPLAAAVVVTAAVLVLVGAAVVVTVGLLLLDVFVVPAVLLALFAAAIPAATSVTVGALAFGEAAQFEVPHPVENKAVVTAATIRHRKLFPVEGE